MAYRWAYMDMMVLDELDYLPFSASPLPSLAPRALTFPNTSAGLLNATRSVEKSEG